MLTIIMKSHLSQNKKQRQKWIWRKLKKFGKKEEHKEFLAQTIKRRKRFTQNIKIVKELLNHDKKRDWTGLETNKTARKKLIYLKI